MIKYLGSKRQLIPWIADNLASKFPHASSVLDLFSGTSRVGHALKRAGYQVHANDHNLFAYHIARCYVETDITDLPKDFTQILDHLNSLAGVPGFFTENYSIKSRFFHPKNGEKIDAIRQEIEQLHIDSRTRSVLLTSLMEAADRVDSTCGLQMAYLKAWAKRAFLPLKLRVPELLPQAKGGPSAAHCLDAAAAAQAISCDIAYLDPPYNQHSYRSNYHIWETLVRFDHPEMYGKVQKRLDCQTVKSSFNSKRSFYDAISQVITNLRCKHIALSFNDEGFVTKDQLVTLLSQFGDVSVLETEYRRYVGAQIGIYNQAGQKVGNVKKLHNKELLFLVDKE